MRLTRKKFVFAAVLLPLALVILLAAGLSGVTGTAAGCLYGSYGCGGSTGNTWTATPVNLPAVPDRSYGLRNQMLFVANGRASNVAVVDVGTMSIIDYIPVPVAPINAAAAAGQAGATLDKAIQGLGINAPIHVPDMFYWEVHGVVPSADRSHIYAVGALSFTPSDFTMYEVNTKTRQTDRQIPLAVSEVGYCGLEYDRNDESSGWLEAESMQTGPADLAALFGSPLQLRDPLAGLLPALGLGNLFNSLENQLPAAVGGISEEDLQSGTNTGFIATDYNSDGSSSTCGIAWDASGNRAFASQMFEPLIDKIDWQTKTVDGEILPIEPYKGVTQHQLTSAKSRGLLFAATGIDGVSVFDANLSTLVGHIDINSLVGHIVAVHGVEMAPGNDNVIYVTADGSPTGTYVIDTSDINSPMLIGGLQTGLDPSACGTYAIPDKQSYYIATGKCERPDLHLFKDKTYWASYADYQAHDLSVDLHILNQSVQTAGSVTITDIQNTNGVGTMTPLPINLGDVDGGANSSEFTVVYQLPAGVKGFHSQFFGTATGICGNTYYYPF